MPTVVGPYRGVMSNTDFVLTPLDAETADSLRARGGEIYVADAKPGYPCRQCLTDAEIGAELILVSHDPFDLDLVTPYRSRSPIFLHRIPCDPPHDLSQIPEQLLVRELSVRSFDAAGAMIDAARIDGAELGSTLEQLFTELAAEVIHVHNAVRGCWATTVVPVRSPAS